MKRDVFKSLIDQMFRLEEENKQLKEQSTKSSSAGSGGGGEINQEELLRRVKLEVLGDSRLLDEMEL